MSYAMTHFIINDIFSRNRIHEARDYALLAAVAPDAVHMNPGFTKRLKAHSHFMQDSQNWGEIYEQEEINIWYGRVRDAYRARWDKLQQKLSPCNERGETLGADKLEAKELAFLQGYFVHVLTDLFNASDLYSGYFIKNGFQLDAFYPRYREECVQQDFYLYQNYEHIAEVEAAVARAAQDPDLDQMLTDLDLAQYFSADHLRSTVEYQFGKFGKAAPASLDGLKMATPAATDHFLNHVESECERMLFTFPEVENEFRVKIPVD